ncbi:hypothetical protein CTI12_AA113410 [Artemisia annua]|uniref:Uncharacterized protein n=1 Tax=Artemisia annua TaxID=35608 RepID=A0A2U1PS05_ARTAN|nr:hypothetical protein CTI12_AA113410 [Artemisia annua]
MFASNEPPSLSSNGMNSYNEDTTMMEASDGHVHIAAPSYSGVVHGQGTSHKELHDTTTYRQLADQTAKNVEEKKAPSFTALVHGQGNSYTHDENASRGGDGQAPSLGAMTRGTVSHPSGGGDPYSGDQKAPSRGALNKRESSQTGGSSVVFEGADVQEFVGMSLVGKNFRKFYPNAYYKEKDGDN